MGSIFFSIVIPTYNSQSTILKCIKSCIKQSYKEFEIIIIDDCSSDATVEIIEEFVKKENIDNIKIKRLELNGGASVARNTGMKMAKGGYIALLDSDDYFHPKKLEIINKLILANSKIDLLGHDYYIEDDIDSSNLTINTKDMELKKIECNQLLLSNFAVTPSVIFKKSINLYFNEEMRYTEDHEFFLRVCYKDFKIYYLNKKLVGLNRGILSAGGQSSNNLKMRLGEIQMYLGLYKLNNKYIFITPFLVLFSIFKHLYKVIERFFNGK